jgi:hypothetical protein
MTSRVYNRKVVENSPEGKVYNQPHYKRSVSGDLRMATHRPPSEMVVKGWTWTRAYCNTSKIVPTLSMFNLGAFPLTFAYE